MRYYGTITGLSVGGAAAPPAVIPGGGDDDEIIPGAGKMRGLGLFCVVGLVLVGGMIWLISRALTKRRPK